MKFTLLTLFFVALAATLSAQTANVVSKEMYDWQKITETVVYLEKDVAEIMIPGKERYVSIYFRVAEAQIDLKSLVIVYENEEKQDIAVNEEIKVNSNSRIIDLSGEARSIKKIEFKYKPIAHTDDKKVRLELWGSQVKRRGN